MQHYAILGAVLAAVTLGGCSSKTDANNRNFNAALTKYLEKKGDLCLNITRWPVDVDKMDLRMQETIKTGTANRMAALEQAGLVKGEETEIQGSGFNEGMHYTVKRYTLLDAAKPFVREKEVTHFGLGGSQKVMQSDLCWGEMALDKVVKWEGPMKLGDYQEASVVYTYKINDVADWAKRTEVQAAFPNIKSTLGGEGSQESRHAVKLTSEGWEAKGLD